MKVFAKLFGFIFTFVLLGVSGWYLQSYNLLRLEPVEIVEDPKAAEPGLFWIIQRDLKKKLRPLEKQYIWQVSLEKILGLIETDSRVRSVHIARQFPNRLIISIEPHETVANILDVNGNLRPVAADGTLLPPLQAGLAPDRPVLRGPRFINNSELRARAVRMLLELPDGGNLSRKNVSEVNFKDRDGFTLLLMQNGLQVRLGDEAFGQKASRIEQVLNYLQNQQIKGRVIDARFSKKVVVKLRNQP